MGSRAILRRAFSAGSLAMARTSATSRTTMRERSCRRRDVIASSSIVQAAQPFERAGAHQQMDRKAAAAGHRKALLGKRWAKLGTGGAHWELPKRSASTAPGSLRFQGGLFVDGIGESQPSGLPSGAQPQAGQRISELVRGLMTAATRAGHAMARFVLRHGHVDRVVGKRI